MVNVLGIAGLAKCYQTLPGINPASPAQS